MGAVSFNSNKIARYCRLSINMKAMFVFVVIVASSLAMPMDDLGFGCSEPGKTFTDDGCTTCHICSQDLTPTALPTCENGTLCDITLGYCNFADQVVCPSDMYTGWHRTVILIEKETEFGEELFIRGGISEFQRAGCTDDARTSECALDIRVRSVGSGDGFAAYNAYKNGDQKLDWYGAENNQGTYHGQQAEGTAMMWTTNDKENQLYNAFNKYGENYWVVDMDMDCEQTERGWFEVKGVLSGGEYEEDVHADACRGNIGGMPPYMSSNHMARCGFVNVFHFDQSDCEINTVPSHSFIH